MANDIKNENENHVLKPLPPVIKNIVNKNHVLKPYPPVPPVSFPKEKKKEMPIYKSAKFIIPSAMCHEQWITTRNS